MRAFLAMLVDGYRLLNARKMFWITLVLTSGVTLVFMSIGFSETGMTYFFGLSSSESEFVHDGTPLARIVYRGVFSTFIVELWLAWAATLLGLISTTTIFPEFLAGGAIDMVLSKPIGRVRLFIYKYLASLLFVVLQVSIVCVGAFIAMVWRLGDWNWMLFAAIPLVTLFYSYFYCVNVLVGVVTRSSLTALLASVLFLLSLFSLNLSEGVVHRFRTQFEVQMEEDEAALERVRRTMERTASTERAEQAMARLEVELQTMQSMRDEKARVIDGLRPWHDGLRAVQQVLPKSTDTIVLLERWLKEESDLNLLDVMRGNVTTDAGGDFVPAHHGQAREIEQRMLAESESLSVWYVIGTSLLFEGVVLGLACVVFVRRDY